jgi:hypothetical protein
MAQDVVVEIEDADVRGGAVDLLLPAGLPEQGVRRRCL